MSEAQKLRNELKEKLADLQEFCSHEKSTWMQSMWAPGHFGGWVKVCDRCEKILKRAETLDGIN